MAENDNSDVFQSAERLREEWTLEMADDFIHFTEGVLDVHRPDTTYEKRAKGRRCFGLKNMWR